MGELERTYFERLMCQALTDLKIEFSIFQLWCFHCRDSFLWEKYEFPPQCAIGKHKFVDKQVARPDIIISSMDKKTKGVIRIDGPVHQKRKVKNKDFWQTKMFIEQGVRVFIVENSDINPGKPDYACNFTPHALALLFQRLLDEPNLYDRLYFTSSHMKSHFRKI